MKRIILLTLALTFLAAPLPAQASTALPDVECIVWHIRGWKTIYLGNCPNRPR